MTVLVPLAICVVTAQPAVVVDPGSASVTRLVSPYTGRPLAGQGGSVCGGVLLPGQAGPRDPETVVWRVQEDGDDTLLQGRADGVAGGMKGIALGIRGVPDDLDVILPATSGMKLTRESAPPSFRATWPIEWEAGLVVFQGEGEGFAVMADGDPVRFKGIEILHREECWDVTLESYGDAPWSSLTSHETFPWRIVCYQGDWRVPADRYKQHLEAYHDLAAARAAEPSWVDDIRLCILMEPDQSLLEPLASRCDAAQTLLYIPAWRRDPYDRDYPDYTPADGFAEFIGRAHELGFRVMPHFNYFGVDPLHPLYEELKDCQLRDPDSGSLMWWLWDRVDPAIKFAYIHPGSRRWQAELVDRMAAAWEELHFDAAHIDQTLVVPNHAGGPVDGVTAPLGALNLHRALREALPQVALSGEGLNEITFAYEAFAQRHVYGYNHADGVWDRRWLDRAHPISAYLFTPHTTHYGYLGMASPEDGQAYSAWRHAYRRQNVIPTIAWPGARTLEDPSGFWPVAFDEARVWQTLQLRPDVAGPWPDDVCYGYRSADGRRAEYRDDQGTVFEAGGEVIYRVITGVETVALPGTLDGWRYYTAEALLGLNPERWYLYRDSPRSMSIFHVEAAPPDAEVQVSAPSDGFTRVLLRDKGRTVLDMADALPTARCALVVDGETVLWQAGGLRETDAYGASVASGAEGLYFHPPWRGDQGGDPVVGNALVRYELTLPAAHRLVFRGHFRLRNGAEGRSDGVGFSVRATAQDGLMEPLAADAVVDTEAGQVIELDLTPLAGHQVAIDISCGPGPAGDPSFDWGALVGPAVLRERRELVPIVVAGVLPGSPVGADLERMADGRARLTCPVPGAVYFTDHRPATLTLPTDLTELPWRVTARDSDGMDQPLGQYAGLAVEPGVVQGVPLDGMSTHPPDGGEIALQAVVTLPAEPCGFSAQVGLRDGSRSDGVTFAVWVGGMPLASLHVEPGPRHELSADLSAFAGRTVVIELVVDSEGSHFYDWAHWGLPTLTPTRAPRR